MSHPYTRISSFENSLAKLQNRVPEICHFVLCIFYLECEERKFSTVSLRYYVSVSTEKEYIMCQELEHRVKKKLILLYSVVRAKRWFQRPS